VALTRFLLDRPRGAIGRVTEIDTSSAETFRRQTCALKDVHPDHRRTGRTRHRHYRVTARPTGGFRPAISCDRFRRAYEDGTTDVTRTSRSASDAEMRDRFTRVCAQSRLRARIPDGTTGAQLDSLAAIFVAGRPRFEHGTGQASAAIFPCMKAARISKLGTAPLKRGMILSTSRLLQDRRYGIRIEI